MNMGKSKKVRITLAKLLAIVKEGSGATVSEVESARRLISSLCKKYGISEDSLFSEAEYDDRRFVMGTEKWAFPLFLRCFMNVVGDSSRTYSRQGREVWLECSQHEFIDIQLMWDWHRSQYKKELAVIVNGFDWAYISHHSLWFPAETVASAEPPTDEVIALSKKARWLKAVLEDVYYRKSLPAGE